MNKLVREGLDFERVKDPHQAMGIGIRAQIEQWLKDMWVENWVINDDLTIDVDGYVYLECKNLITIPEFIQFRRINGEFNIYENELISLKGCPINVTGNFWCNNNKLLSLEHSPLLVGASFGCSHNLINSLEGAPSSVGKNFYCRFNPTKFSTEDVRKVCNVTETIYV